MDKQKQIEELAKAIQIGGCIYNDRVNCDSCLFYQGIIDKHNNAPSCTEYYKANSLYEAGYRKIPEGAVVLTEEKYNELKGRAEQVFDEMTERMKAEVAIERKMGNRKVEQSRKETAREILEELWNNKFEATITIQNNCSKEDVENIAKTILLSIRNKLKEIAKQYGVEVEDNGRA